MSFIFNHTFIKDRFYLSDSPCKLPCNATGPSRRDVFIPAHPSGLACSNKFNKWFAV